MSDEQILSNNEIKNDIERQERERKEQRAIDMSNECRQRLIESMKKINSKIITASKSKSESRGSDTSTGNNSGTGNNSNSGIALLFSGGIDSCAILEVASIIGMKLDLLITVLIIVAIVVLVIIVTVVLHYYFQVVLIVVLS